MSNRVREKMRRVEQYLAEYKLNMPEIILEQSNNEIDHKQQTRMQLVKKLKESLSSKSNFKRVFSTSRINKSPDSLSYTKQSIQKAPKRVRFELENKKIIPVERYINNYKWEHYADIAEIKESNEKRELISIAKTQMKDHNNLKLSKYEAIIEKIYGKIKTNRISFSELEPIPIEDENSEIQRESIIDEIGRASCRERVYVRV